MGDQAQVKKLTGEIWAEILSKVRCSGLSVADKVAAMGFITEQATGLADEVRHGDFDGKIADKAKEAHEAIANAAMETAKLCQLIRESKLHKPQPPGLEDVSSIETALHTLRDKMKKVSAFYAAHAPTIVDRVGALAHAKPAALALDEDLPF